MAIAKRVSYASSSLTQTGVDVVAGELIEVNVVTYGALAPATIQDNAFGGTNAYLECGSGVAYSNSGHQLHKFYGIAKATETLQIDVNVAGTYPGIIVVIRNGNDTTLANVLVAYYNDAAEGSSGTAHTSASATTVNADDFVSVLWAFNIGNSYLTENGAGFTEEQRRTASGFPSWANFGRSAATPGSYADVVTSSAANYAGNIVAVYKAAAAGVSGSGGTTQPVQTISGAGTLQINGAGATSQPVQAISGTGTVGAPSGVTGSGGTTQPAQVIAGTGSVTVPPAALNGPPRSEIQTLTPGAELEFFVLNATVLGGSILRFHNGVNALGSDVVWQGQTYTRYPIQASGFEMTSKGVMPRPTLQVANIIPTVSAEIRAYGDLVGATVTRKRTLAKFLDAVNFPGGVNPTADPTGQFLDDVFYVERKSEENQISITFELSAACDLQGLLLPRGIVQASVCMEHDAKVCPYSVGNLCTKSLDACKAHYLGADLPFGAFPGSGLVNT